MTSRTSRLPTWIFFAITVVICHGAPSSPPFVYPRFSAVVVLSRRALGAAPDDVAGLVRSFDPRA